jgi:hypothetical protein
MKVEDFKVSGEVADAGELAIVLARRHGNGVNEFWLSHGNDRYPAISLLVKGDLAALHYLRNETGAGFRSAGNLANLAAGATTTFWISAGGETIDVLNDAVMPFSVALAAAQEFLISRELPRSVEWFEL